MSLFDLSREMNSSPNALLSDHQKRLKDDIFKVGFPRSFFFTIVQVVTGGNGGRQVTEEEVRRAMSQAIVRQVYPSLFFSPP